MIVRRARGSIRLFVVTVLVGAATTGSAFASWGGGGGGSGGPTSGGSFQVLATLPGMTTTYGEGVSGDGKVAVGYSIDANNLDHAWRWTAATGVREIAADAEAYAASADGTYVVGSIQDAAGHHAFRWTAAGGLQAITPYDGLDVSSDGSVVVGGGAWSQSTGAFTYGSGLAGYGASGQGVSSDGGTVVGWSETASSFVHAFSWTRAGGIKDLGVTTGTESIAQDASTNGAVIVGQARDRNDYWRAFRWTASSGMKDIGTLGGPMSVAYKVTDDGTAAVGTSLTTSSSASNHAFRWSSTRGMQDLQKALTTAGATGLTGYILWTANGVSTDGTVIVGTALDPARHWVAFRAVLPR